MMVMISLLYFFLFSNVQCAIRFYMGSLFYLECAVKRDAHVHTFVGYSIFRPPRHALSN